MTSGSATVIWWRHPFGIMSTKISFALREQDIPTQWYNLLADFPEPLPPPLHPGTKQPVTPDLLTAIFPENLVMQEMCPDRWVQIPDEVREIYALWRPTPLLRAVRLEKALQTPAHIYYKYEGASPAGSHKPNTAVAAGLLQQGRRHQTPGHRDRRGPVGFGLGAGLQAVWPGVQCLHGQGELPAEAVSPHADAHLGRDGACQPQRPDRIRPQSARRRPELPRQPRHRHQRSHRGHRQTSAHEILARQRAQPRLPAPNRHRPGSHQADGNGRRGAGRDHRLLRRRQQFRRHGVSVHSQENHREEKISHRGRRTVRLSVADEGRTALRFRRHGG